MKGRGRSEGREGGVKGEMHFLVCLNYSTVRGQVKKTREVSDG